MKITTLAPWYGSNRTLAATVGLQLGQLAWCGVPFCGGCPELPHIRTRGGVASDLHRHIINLARCIADVDLKAELVDRLDGLLFHPDELRAAQRRCIERVAVSPLFGQRAMCNGEADPKWAADYFVCSWMGLGGHAGKRTEFGQGLSLRYTSSGGDSARRFRSAIESLEAWHLSLRIWSFDCVDAFAMLDRVVDQAGHGLYIDAPWPEAGDEYEHEFRGARHDRLAERLGEFEHARVVIRYGDHPLIRDLYPASQWTWVEQQSRSQTNGTVAEVLILNGPSYDGKDSTCHRTEAMATGTATSPAASS